MRFLVLRAIVVLTAPAILHAGICVDRSADPPRSRHEVRLLAGYSPSSTSWIGTVEGRSLTLIEAGYAYRCWTWTHVAASYSGGIAPAVILRQPEQSLGGILAPGVKPGPPLFRLPGRTVYGFGFMPVGAQFEFGYRRAWHPIAEAHGGLLATTEPVPYNLPGATSVNFMFDFGGGLRWRFRENHAVTFGYRFVHISNAGRTRVNPGLDQNLAYIGYSFLP